MPKLKEDFVKKLKKFMKSKGDKKQLQIEAIKKKIKGARDANFTRMV